MKTITIDKAISYVIGLFTDEPNFSYLTYYFHTYTDNSLTYNLFISDINGDWEHEDLTYFNNYEAV